MSCTECSYRSTNVVNVDRMEAALHELYEECTGSDGTPVNLTSKVGAGTANGSFDREGYIVSTLSVPL